MLYNIKYCEWRLGKSNAQNHNSVQPKFNGLYTKNQKNKINQKNF